MVAYELYSFDKIKGYDALIIRSGTTVTKRIIEVRTTSR